MRSVATLALLVVGASLSLAQNPVGNWKGKLNIKFPPIPANATPQQKAQFTEMKGKIAKAVITLTLSGNKTWSLKATGLPMSPNGGEKGTWTQAGKTITMKTTPKPGGPVAPPQTATLSADGKTMTVLIPNGMGSIVFKK